MRPNARDLFFAFLALGLGGFGGPAAHVALMEESLVRRRQWVSREDFLAAYGTVQLLPGPTSTELALVLGRKLLGWRGFWLAALGFILPAVLLTWGLAVGWGALHATALDDRLRFGLGPAVVALLLVTSVRLGRGLAAAPWQLAVAAIVGASATAWALMPDDPIVMSALSSAFQRLPPAPVSLFGLFWFFLGLGSVIVGSGYALVPWLGLLAQDWLAWLTPQDTLDAVAAGHLTPGPLFATATFAGYRMLGHAGALAATLGMFIPAFGYAAGAEWLGRWLEAARWRRVVRDGVAAASVGLIAAACVPFALTLTPRGVALTVAGIVLLARVSQSATLAFVGLVALGAALGR